MSFRSIFSGSLTVSDEEALASLDRSYTQLRPALRSIVAPNEEDLKELKKEEAKLDEIFSEKELPAKDEEVKESTVPKKFEHFRPDFLKQMIILLKPLSADKVAKFLKQFSPEQIEHILKLQTPDKAQGIRAHLSKSGSDKEAEIDSDKSQFQRSQKRF